jgi:potassium-transporting ATPase potassium-binding subunit
VLDIVFVLAIIAILYRPLGDYMAAVYSSPKDRKFEHGIYRLIGVDPRSAQTWQYYLRAVLAFSAVSVLLLLLLQRIQTTLPFALGLPAVPGGLAFNTAASFVTNTNWQSDSPEATLGSAGAPG